MQAIPSSPTDAQNGTASLESLQYFVLEQLIDFPDERELGNDAVITISSAKPGNGVEQLRDNSLETFWQSDGSFPHFINVQFVRKVCLTKICIYIDHGTDESYTPRKIAISIGTCPHDLIDMVTAELSEITGWIVFDLAQVAQKSTLDDLSTAAVKAHFLQIRVLSMHQNGKDTHIRQLRVYGKREPQRVMGDLYHDDFKSSAMAQFCVIR